MSISHSLMSLATLGPMLFCSGVGLESGHGAAMTSNMATLSIDRPCPMGPSRSCCRKAIVGTPLFLTKASRFE